MGTECYNCGRDDLIPVPFVAGGYSYCYRCVTMHGRKNLEELHGIGYPSKFNVGDVVKTTVNIKFGNGTGIGIGTESHVETVWLGNGIGIWWYRLKDIGWDFLEQELEEVKEIVSTEIAPRNIRDEILSHIFSS